MKNLYHLIDKMEYPFEPHYLQIGTHKLHYIDEGKGPVLLFVHGTPSWSFDFRKIITHFSRTHRCIAIDHLGFGKSDKAPDYPYSTRQHSENLKLLITKLNLSNIHFVVHDFGGPIALNYALDHPENTGSVTILNSWLWDSSADPDFIKLKKILKSPLLPFLYLRLNLSARFILPGSFGKRKLSKHISKQYTLPFPEKNQRYGPLAFARSLLNDQQWFGTLWEKRETLQSKPILLIWGMRDKVVRPHHLERFQQGFPQATTCSIEDAGHFPQEEYPETVIEQLEKFLAANSVTSL
ncbi:MAG: alpha/beta fold hydrolase [Flavobacteriales bacterium]